MNCEWVRGSLTGNKLSPPWSLISLALSQRAQASLMCAALRDGMLQSCSTWAITNCMTCSGDFLLHLAPRVSGPTQRRKLPESASQARSVHTRQRGGLEA